MPQRFLRPGITTSDRWNSVSFGAESLYIRLLTLVDDFGRYDARIPIIHGQCFALRTDVTPQQTAGFRSELVKHHLIEVYIVDGKEYLQFTKWQERARSERSKFPENSQVVDISTSAADGSGIPQNPASLVPRSSPSTLDQTPSTKARPASVEAVIDFCSSVGITVDDGEYFWEKWNGDGFKNAGKSMKDWKAVIRSWKLAGHCPSQKPGFKPSREKERAFWTPPNAHLLPSFSDELRDDFIKHHGHKPEAANIIARLKEISAESV